MGSSRHARKRARRRLFVRRCIIVLIMLALVAAGGTLLYRYAAKWLFPLTPTESGDSSDAPAVTATATATTTTTTTTARKTTTEKKTAPTESKTTTPVASTAPFKKRSTTATTASRVSPVSPVPASHQIKGVPMIAQRPAYPTGCESVSAVMAMQYAGDKITVDEFIDNCLERDFRFYYQGGEQYGPDPYAVFVGNPRTDSSYGCMAPPIEAAMKKYYGQTGCVYNTTGMELDELCAAYISRDVPVLIWASIAMIPTEPGVGWRLPDGSWFNWINNEHCVLLVGYDENRYYCNDPYAGRTVSYAKSTVRQRFSELGKQSLVIMK